MREIEEKKTPPTPTSWRDRASPNRGGIFGYCGQVVRNGRGRYNLKRYMIRSKKILFSFFENYDDYQYWDDSKTEDIKPIPKY